MVNNYYKKVRKFLVQNLIREYSFYWGISDFRWIDHVADAWINDQSNSRWRYELIKKFFNDDSDYSYNYKMLDMASGCGTFVFYGLLNGYDVYGIDPAEWKNKFNKMKIKLYNYSRSWIGHFIKAVGEYLPFKDESFDIVSSYQTLEHVSDVEKCLQEMLRIVREGGSMFLHFPDYRSTFESHYRLPWIPLFPKTLARFYLKVLGRPTLGLDTINYVTKRNIMRYFKDKQFEVIDLDCVFFHKRSKNIIEKFNFKRIGSMGKVLAVIINLIYTYFYMPIKRMFRSEKSVTIVVRKP